MTSVGNSSKGRVKISPDLFSINNLEHYVEIKYGLLQDLPFEQARERKQRLALKRPEFDKNLHHDQRREIRDCRRYLAIAAMDMIYGNYQKALEELDRAERGYRKLYTQEHITRLEISSFRALLLALNSKPSEAEGLCRRTIKMLSEEKGYEHPLTLVTTSIMVIILLNLWHFVSAMNMATSLIRRTKGALGDNNGLTLHCKVQLAGVKYYSGDYSGAEADLEPIMPALENSLTSDHPDLFQYQCFLAKIYIKRGRIEAAERRLVPALEMKLQEYYRHWMLRGTRQSIEGTGIPQYKLVDFLNTFVRDPKAAFLGQKPHPQFLDVLTAQADIVFRRSAKDFAISILRAIWVQEKAQLGNTHLVTAATLGRLAIVTSETQKDYGVCIGAREQLEEAAKVVKEILGKTHVSTLCVRREELRLGYKIKSLVNPGPWGENEEKDPIYFKGRDVYAESQYIYDSHKSHLGRYHIETIQSLLWLFKIRLSKSLDEQTKAIANELLICLRSPWERGNRSIQSLSQEGFVAFTFYQFGHYPTAEEVSTQILHAIDDSLAMGNQEMRNTLEKMRRQNLDFVNYLREQLEGKGS
ncbi:hypothetical protein F4781DRAFT_436928 [Annulohypoxylon bovei var. microspora]|nr:hypothetical protein F4781DRAFT_436928 [Annulohypoxylon bovei var. microspora]